jgi:hypothetical protein
MDNPWLIAGIVVYGLIGAAVYWFLSGITGSAEMATWKAVLWAATWPLIPVWLRMN